LAQAEILQLLTRLNPDGQRITTIREYPKVPEVYVDETIAGLDSFTFLWSDACLRV
jgi:hypothetical protein